MLFTVGMGEGGYVETVSMGVLVGWYSCPNSPISTQPLLRMEYPVDPITQQNR